MKPFVIVNPRSANGATGKQFDTIAAAIRSSVGEHAHAFTERPLHATELARRAIESGHDLVIAVGGDGTINEVANGFFAEARPGEAPRPVNPQAALAVVPRGTGGDFRKTIGLDEKLDKSAERLRAAPRRLDVGAVEYTDEQGKPGLRLFVNVADAGLGGEVVRIANRSSKLLGGKLTFKLASARALLGWRDQRVRFSLDGGPAEEIDVTGFNVANGRFFGGGMMVAPEAQLDDGLFHLTIWTGFGLGDFVTKSKQIYDGTHVKLAGTRTATARTVRLEPVETKGGRPVLLDLDGEQCGRLPATMTVLPGAIGLVG
jgi:YegS/Rv2252/BmrU family lipid kinase